MKMKISPSLVIYFLAIIIVVFSEFSYLFEDLNLNPDDYARITDVDYKAVLVDEPGSKGKIIVTERLTFDIHAASRDNLFWELWRDLPEDYVDGLKVGYKVNYVKQILANGTELVYKESPKLYWDDEDYTDTYRGYGPGKWYHSEGPYNESRRNYECVFFYVDGLYREKVTFEIEYEMTNAALRYNDCSELYLSMYSEETIKYLKSFKGQILIPTEDMPSEGNYTANTYGTNSHTFPFTESTSINPGYHTFLFELDESNLKFKPYNQYIEFDLVSYGTDKDIFTTYAPNNYYSDENVLSELREEQEEYDSLPDKYLQTKLIVFFTCFIFALLLLRKLLNADNNIENKYNFYKPTMEIDYFREIPSNLDPTFAADLAFCKDKPKDIPESYAALMLSLVRKGYIELDRIDDNGDWVSSNVKIIVKHRPNQPIVFPQLQLMQDSLEEFFEEKQEQQKELEPLTVTEELYFNLIVKHSKGIEISMDRFQYNVSSDYDNTDSFVKNMEHSTVHIGTSEGYFQKSNYKEPQQKLKSQSILYAIIGIILLLVNLITYNTRLDLALGGFFILGITYLFGSYILNKLSTKYVLLTQFGEDEYAKWNGLYRFLNSETLMSERTVIELPIWEQYLVYATAFGISDKVINALNIRCPEIVEASPILSNSYYRSTNFYSSSRSFRSAARTTSHIASSGGGYGGGYGGYGGGGRGGGGGGGGH